MTTDTPSTWEIEKQNLIGILQREIAARVKLRLDMEKRIAELFDEHHPDGDARAVELGRWVERLTMPETAFEDVPEKNIPHGPDLTWASSGRGYTFEEAVTEARRLKELSFWWRGHQFDSATARALDAKV